MVKSSQLQNRVYSFVKTASKDDEWLEKTENTSLGYLLFKNGIYNMKTSEFKKGFDPKIVFHTRVPWNFPKDDKKEIKEACKISFDKIFEEPKPMIAALARALAGDIKIKKLYFCPGRPNTGKYKLAYVRNMHLVNILEILMENHWLIHHQKIQKMKQPNKMGIISKIL